MRISFFPFLLVFPYFLSHNTTTTMTYRLHIVRHAEGTHNLAHDTSILDPELTPHGVSQAQNLRHSFPYKPEVGLVIASPLRRTLLTAYEGFRDVLDQRYFLNGSGDGVADGAHLLLDPDVQAHSDRPCDTGSEVRVLEAAFPDLSFGDLDAKWHVKVGVYAGDSESVGRRAEKVRQRLVGQFQQLAEGQGERKDIVVVTHGGMIGQLLGAPKYRGIGEADWRSFAVTQDEEGNVILSEL